MPVKDEPKTAVKVENKNVNTAVDLGLEDTPGFHVLQDGTFLGTYETREDAQAFIDGHVTPQQLAAEIVEGTASVE